MKNHKLQCKDIPDIPILQFLGDLQGDWACRWENWNGVTNAMPLNTPEKLVLAKMKKLIGRGLVTGCTCGCRGDFELTNIGWDYLHDYNLKNSVGRRLSGSVVRPMLGLKAYTMRVEEDPHIFNFHDTPPNAIYSIQENTLWVENGASHKFKHADTANKAFDSLRITIKI